MFDLTESSVLQDVIGSKPLKIHIRSHVEVVKNSVNETKNEATIN